MKNVYVSSRSPAVTTLARDFHHRHVATYAGSEEVSLSR